MWGKKKLVWVFQKTQTHFVRDCLDGSSKQFAHFMHRHAFPAFVMKQTFTSGEEDRRLSRKSQNKAAKTVWHNDALFGSGANILTENDICVPFPSPRFSFEVRKLRCEGVPDVEQHLWGKNSCCDQGAMSSFSYFNIIVSSFIFIGLSLLLTDLSFVFSVFPCLTKLSRRFRASLFISALLPLLPP